MPTRPLPPCGWRGHPPCSERRGTTRAGQWMCDPHDAMMREASDKARGTFRARGYSHAGHDAFKAGVLGRDNQCTCDQHCYSHHELGPCLNAATVADHWPRTKAALIKAGLDSDDPNYGRGLCKACHDRHSARSTGRHGYRRST